MTLDTSAAGAHVCVIIHSHRPYCFDLNEIMALPAGFRYRNRFDLQWIEPNLRQDPESLIGKRILIILRDVTNNRLVPVRWGKLFNVERVGKVALFEYHLDELVAYNNADNVRLQEIIDRTKTFADNHAWLPGAAGQPLDKPSVFESTVGAGLPVVDAANLTAWGNAVSALATAPVYEGIEFLKIVALRSADGSPAPVVNESFLVKPNSVYELKVFQHVPEPGQAEIPSHSLELNTFSGHVTALRSRLQAVGKYDMLTFVVKVLALSPGDQTAMEIPHMPDAATTKSAHTSLYLPLRVEEAGRLRIATALAVGAISLFFMFRPEFGSLPDDLVRNIATVLFVLTLAGPSRTLSTVWPSWPWGSDK